MGKKVKFKYFRDSTFYYETECGFIFPVSLSEVGTSTFQAEDKALLFMRWIRKHIDLLNAGAEKSGE